MASRAPHERRDEPRGTARLPLQPLLDALPIDRALARQDIVGPGITAQAADLLDVSTRTLHRYRHSGLTPWTADRLAIAAGHHPLAVWGDAWTRAIQAQPARETQEVPTAYSAPSLCR
jgi:hypothetical protein